MEAYQRYKRSRAGWEKTHARWVNLYYQKDKPISPGRWTGASDESIPLLTESVNQFHTRLYSSMFANRRLVVARPVGRASQGDEQRAERIGLHMTWQLTVQDRSYRRNKDRLLLDVPKSGMAFTKAFRDPYRRMNIVQNVRAMDLLVPYGIGPRNLEDIERKIQVIWTSVNKTKQLAAVGRLSGPGVPTDLKFDELSAPELNEQKAQGIEPSADEPESDRPVLLLESHELWDLDGDGLAEPYIVHVDPTALKVLGVAIRWETDPLGNPLQLPWYDAKRPVEHFTAWTFLENPDGFYGLGLGHILGEINLATNRLLREIIDAGALATIGNMSGFTSQSVTGEAGGEVRLALGVFRKLSAGMDDINKAFKTFDFKGPSPAMFQVLEALMARGDRIGLNTEAVTGQLDKALQPTTVLALLDQSNKSFGSVNERIVNAWTDELEKLFRLNGLHMDPEEYFQVLDTAGGMANQTIGRLDYASDFQVQPTVDPQMQSDKERQTRAQMEYQVLANDPLVLADPTGMAPYMVRRRLLEAFRVDKIDEVLPNPVMLAEYGINIPGLFAAAAAAGKDETGLPESQGGGPASIGTAGMADGSGDQMGPPGGGAPAPGQRAQTGADMGGSAPGAGGPGGGGFPPRGAA